jgi:hypothetical protein
VVDTNKVKDAREATDREGLRDCQTKILSAIQANINAMFEYADAVRHARSVLELVDVSTKHSRRQLEMMNKQAREITDTAQKLAIENAPPLTGGYPFGRMS